MNNFMTMNKKYLILGIIILGAIIVYFILQKPSAPRQPKGTVRTENIVTTCGTNFCINGKKFKFVGANYPQLFAFTHSEMELAFEELSKMGVKVTRVFLDRHGKSHGFYKEINNKKITEEDVDYMLASAEKHDIKLIMTLTNHKQESMPKSCGDDFFKNTKCHDQYFEEITPIVERYKDNPTVFSWELMNEPEFFEPTPNFDDVLNWIDKTSKYIKNLDNKHMVSIGTSGVWKYNYANVEGGDKNYYVSMHELEDIDFTTIHFYGYNYVFDYNKNKIKDLFKNMINDGHALEKPVLLEEFDIKRVWGQNREEWYTFTLDEFFSLGGNGAMFWQFHIIDLSDTEREKTYGITLHPEDANLRRIIQEKAEELNIEAEGNSHDKSQVNRATTFPQKFHVKGNKIVDESGKEVIFRGLDIVTTTYLLKMDQKGRGLVVWSEDIFREMSAWGSKITRIQILPEEWKEDRANAIKMINQTIERSKKYNMYIYLEYNVAGFPPTLKYDKESKSATKQDFIGFWDEISKKYKNEKTVAFYEIMNEPTYSSNKSRLDKVLLKKDWLLWKEFAEEIIDVIRKNDPDSVIIVGGLVWGYDISFALEYPIERENIVYGTHPYPWRSEHKSWNEAFGNIKNKYPVFATEFTVGGLATNLRKWKSVRNELSKIIYLEDLIEDGKKYPSNKQKAHKIALKSVERIKKDRAALNYLISEREKYKREIESYLEDKKISWTGFTFYSIYPEFTMVDENYTPNEQGKWFKQWMLEKKGQNEPQ